MASFAGFASSRMTRRIVCFAQRRVMCTIVATNASSCYTSVNVCKTHTPIALSMRSFVLGNVASAAIRSGWWMFFWFAHSSIAGIVSIVASVALLPAYTGVIHSPRGGKAGGVMTRITIGSTNWRMRCALSYSCRTDLPNWAAIVASCTNLGCT